MESAPTSNERTIETYEHKAAVYTAIEASRPHALQPFLADFAGRIASGARILEIGSATGRDAAYLESRGHTVRRTDAARSFVTALRADGFEADVVNVLSDELGGPYDAVWANAVFHHLSSAEFALALARLALACTRGAVLGFSVKRGDGEEWTSTKVGAPRFFRYWRPDTLNVLIDDSPWQIIEVIEHPGELDDWLNVLCRLPADPPQLS